jgi:hypothetical protein
MYSLMMNLFGSKHAEVIKKIQCFSGLPVAFTSARAGVYIHILVTNKTKVSNQACKPYRSNMSRTIIKVSDTAVIFQPAFSVNSLIRAGAYNILPGNTT